MREAFKLAIKGGYDKYKGNLKTMTENKYKIFLDVDFWKALNSQLPNWNDETRMADFVKDGIGYAEQDGDFHAIPVYHIFMRCMIDESVKEKSLDKYFKEIIKF